MAKSKFHPTVMLTSNICEGSKYLPMNSFKMIGHYDVMTPGYQSTWTRFLFFFLYIPIGECSPHFFNLYSDFI